MKVKVNRTSVELFEGAQVRHAILRYCVQRRFRLSLAEQAEPYDARGHRIGLDSPLREGQIIKCKIK